MRELLALAKEPTFADDKEKKFGMVAIERMELSHAKLWYPASIAFWAICLAVTWHFNYPAATRSLLYISGFTMVAAKILLFIIAKSSKVLRFGQLTGYILSNIIMSAACWSLAGTKAAVDGIAVVWALGSALALALLAFRNYVHIFAVTLFVGLFSWQMTMHHVNIVGIMFGISMVLLTSNSQIVLKRYVKTQMIKSYRQQSIYTPKQVLLQAIEKETSVGDLFRPEMRFCACICADWRSFQSFSSSVTPTELADTLEHYYDLQIKLLDQSFPEGNYFIDWIADELFVVGYMTERCDEKTLIGNAVRYAKASIAARAEFNRSHGAPRGLDAGIAAGMTTVGMLGPEGNKKATALGQIPGVARRLQTLAKELRTTDGDCDRVVVEPSLAGALRIDAFDLISIPVPGAVKVKDLSCTTVLVYEHGPVARRDPQQVTRIHA
jgi:class 3 adenylate cyclase